MKRIFAICLIFLSCSSLFSADQWKKAQGGLFGYLSKMALQNGMHPEKGYLYTIRGMTVIQKLKDHGKQAYLLTVDYVNVFPDENPNNYQPCLLYTEKDLSQHQSFWSQSYLVYCIGQVSCTNISGFDESLYAFKIYSEDNWE